MNDDETWVEGDHANTLNSFDAGDVRTTHAVIAQTFPIDDGRDLEKHQNGTGIGAAGDPAYTIDRQQRPAVAYSIREDAAAGNFSATEIDAARCLQKHQPSVQSHHAQTFLADQMSVRRLTPVECERLMGWPDQHTAPEGIKAPDSKRYAACGDGIVAPVAFWIADRIRMIEGEA